MKGSIPFLFFYYLGKMWFPPSPQTSNKATMVSNFKEKFSHWKVSHVTPTAENLALFRKFGHKVF